MNSVPKWLTLIFQLLNKPNELTRPDVDYNAAKTPLMLAALRRSLQYVEHTTAAERSPWAEGLKERITWFSTGSSTARAILSLSDGHFVSVLMNAQSFAKRVGKAEEEANAQRQDLTSILQSLHI